MRTQATFLEEWLRLTSGTRVSSSTPPPPSHLPPAARSIIHAWSELRDYHASGSPDPQRCLAALYTLVRLQASLYVADPQAKLLLSILSSTSHFPPQSFDPIFRLLYIWLRRSSRPAASLLESAASTLLGLFRPPATFPAQGILLLGALSLVPALSEASRDACLGLLFHILEEERGAAAEEFLPEVLAAVGYALVSSKDDAFNRILASLIGGIWSEKTGRRANLAHGLMILSLLEWVMAGFINSGRAGKIELLCGRLSAENQGADRHARFAVVMASAGILRAFRRVPPEVKFELNASLRHSIERAIAGVANNVVSPKDSILLDVDSESRLLLQCIAIGLARCGPFSFYPPVFICVCLALLNEIFPLISFFRKVLEGQNSGSRVLGVNEVKEHAASVLFKEAGAVAGLLCNMYSFADEGSRTTVENYIWGYCQEFYKMHRLIHLRLKGREGELLKVMDEIAESFFLMVVVFSAEATKRKLESNTSDEFKSDISVRILISFSCIEYLRRIRLPEYTDAVRRAVLAVQENRAACTSFVESMPLYTELINLAGSDRLLVGRTYIWLEDDVQTSRILFYLRVFPTCINHVSGDLFGKVVAPTMFLYMQHQLEKVARASHSVFVAFISSGKDSESEQSDKMGLKEKLVFYYMLRSLEAYPGTTPFEGMASGIVALVRHLPAGSPSIFYCVNCLVEKTKVLCSKAMDQEFGFWKNWQGDSEPFKKVIDLLLRLISIVDIQVLPYLLKLLAQFIGQLPEEGRNVILGELHAHVAESDDVVRKPILVWWLQSLSYLSSQTNSSSYLPSTNGKELNRDALNASDASLQVGAHSRL